MSNNTIRNVGDCNSTSEKLTMQLNVCGVTSSFMPDRNISTFHYITRVEKLRMMTEVGHIECMGELYELLPGNTKWKTCGMCMDTIPPSASKA